MIRAGNDPSPERIRLVLTLALGMGALMILGLGVYMLTVGGQQVAGIALLAVGATEAVLATFLPKLIADRAARAAESRKR